MNNSTIQENRLWHFRQIIETVGGVNEAARIMDKKNSYITAISGPNPNRSIGDRTAATIERAFGLAPGALDAPPPKETRNPDTYLARITSTLANASDTDKEFVLNVAQWIANRSMKLPTTTTGIVITDKDITDL